MEFLKVLSLRLIALVFVFTIWQITSPLAVPASAVETIAAKPSASHDAMDVNTNVVSRESNEFPLAKPKKRAESVKAIASYLSLGEGSVVADIGAGDGEDTWVFADIVSETGTVFAQEIVESMVKKLESEANRRQLSQVRAMLGRSDDPCLPPNSVDLVFLNHTYHHFAKPREMLRGIWRTLKPGGHLIVVDQQFGTLREWVPQERREKEHFWTAETTVVREAREEGFAFIACVEQCWYTEDDFVLIFQRPKELENPGRDPDIFHSIAVKECSHLFLPVGRPYQKPVFIALGEARKLMAPILKESSGEGLEIVLEEWAIKKEDRPPLPPGACLPSVLTKNGDPNLGAEPIDVVFFLDSYHLLFHGGTLLTKIYEKLLPTGCIYVLDRKADKPITRREASHRRKIRPEAVKQEMAMAGFFFWFGGLEPACEVCKACDRFLLVFGKVRPEEILLGKHPVVDSPIISEMSGLWLERNRWHLRGLKRADEKYISMKKLGWKESLEKVPNSSLSDEIW